MKKKKSDLDLFSWTEQCAAAFKSWSFDAADLQPVNKHLLTVGVHTCICHSQHEKRPHIKGLSLCLGPAFQLLGFFMLLSPSVECLTPLWTFWAWADLNWATLSFTSDTNLHKYTTQRQAIFTAASVDISVKALHMNGLTAVCPPVMSIWVCTKWRSLTLRSPSIQWYPVTNAVNTKRKFSYWSWVHLPQLQREPDL